MRRELPSKRATVKTKTGQSRMMTLDAVEFLRRFFLHILPKGFVRIRHFGFLANLLSNRTAFTLPRTPA